MIKQLITNEAKIFEITVNEIDKFDKSKSREYMKISKQISNETGVPVSLIYSYPYFFFIDHWHKLDNEWYFYKNLGSSFCFINELLGEVISKYFGLDTIHYQIARLYVKGKKEEYGIVSKNFCNKDYTYKSCWDYNFEARRDLSILEDVKTICKSEEEYRLLSSDLKTFIIRDFYASQADRTGNNFIFKTTPRGIRLGPLHDYEKDFSSLDPCIYKNQIAALNLYSNKAITALKNDLEFQSLLNILMQADMNIFIQQVEDAHKIIIPPNIKAHYQEHDEEIKKIVKQKRLIK